MDLLLLELILWAGLFFLSWALKDGLETVENEIDATQGTAVAMQASTAKARMEFARPSAVEELIGHYRGAPIYQYAVIDGRRYEFDQVLPDAAQNECETGARIVEPGLLYVHRRGESPAPVEA